MKQEKIQNELLKLVLALRQLDDRGIVAVSNAIQVQLRENEKRVGKCNLSLIK